MTETLLAAVVLLAAAQVMGMFLRREGFLHFPVLASMVILGWLTPQLLGLKDDILLQEGALDMLLLVVIFSIAAIWLGWHKLRIAPRPGRVPMQYDEQRLLIGAFGLTILGTYFALKLRTLPPEMLNAQQWSGIAVVYLFFAKTQVIAFAIAWLVYLKTGSRQALIILGITSLFILEAVFLGVRRAVAIEATLIVLGGLWFERRWLPNRVALTGLVTAGVFFVMIAGDIRSVTRAYRFGAEELNVTELTQGLGELQLVDSLMQRRISNTAEARNAARLIYYAHQSSEFDFGVDYYNTLIQRYVPGQFVGHEFKRSLQVIPDTEFQRFKDATFSYRLGTTFTGFADVFNAFWYFGALIFTLIAALFRFLYDRAMGGSLFFQFLYLMLIAQGLHTITHSTTFFFSGLPYVFVFAGPIFFAAAYRRRSPAQGDAGDTVLAAGLAR